MIVHPTATSPVSKTYCTQGCNGRPKPKCDAWKFGYRIVAVNDVYENKVDGIYVHEGTK